jgi:hypothetical protein
VRQLTHHYACMICGLAELNEATVLRCASQNKQQVSQSKYDISIPVIKRHRDRKEWYSTPQSKWTSRKQYFIPSTANNLALSDSRGPGSVVDKATSYGLDDPGIESRWGRDFPHLSRPVLSAYPASCTMGTGSFPGINSGRGVTLTPHLLLVSWSKKG